MSIDVAARRRVVFDLSTTPEVFVGPHSEGAESGLEPAVATAAGTNGGNASPVLSGIPTTALDAEIVCRRGGPISAPYSEGGAQFRWREIDDGNDMWRGYGHRRTYRIGETTEVIRSRARTGTSQNALSRPSGVVIPFGDYAGRFVVAVERRTNSGFPANYAVDVLYRGSTDSPTWTRVADVVGGETGRRTPRIVCRPDGMLILYHTAVNDSGTNYKLSSRFSVDGGATWSDLNDDAADVDDFGIDVDKITVEYVFGYYVMTISTEAADPRWLVSVDGGISFRQVADFSVGASGIRLFTFVPLVDDTLLAVWVVTSGGNDSVRCTNVAAGLDYPDISDYREIQGGLVAGSLTGLLAWREYDGVPCVAVKEPLAGGPTWRVLRGSIDGVSWSGVNVFPGLFSVFSQPAPSAVDVGPTDVDIIPYQGTWGLLWCNVGVASSSLYPVEERSLNWTPGSGGSNVSEDWDWQFTWSIAAGTPSGTGLPFTFVGSAALISFAENPTYIRMTGMGANFAYWEVASTSTANFPNADRRNANMTAVATAVYRLGETADVQALQVRGSDGVESREAKLRLTVDGWFLYDQNNTEIARGTVDNSLWQEYILGVTEDAAGSAGAFLYSLRQRAWNGGQGDRVWNNLATGTHTPFTGAGAGTMGDVKVGSVGVLGAGHTFDVIFGSFVLDQGVADWADGDGDSLFAESASSVTAGHVMSALPVPIREDVYVSFSGDVAASRRATSTPGAT
jgi:hypothetical protein